MFTRQKKKGQTRHILCLALKGLSQTYFMSGFLSGRYEARLALPDNQLTQFKIEFNSCFESELGESERETQRDGDEKH